MSVLLGKKMGITSVFTPDGDYVPCTVIEAGPCPVVTVRTPERDGYEAVQIGYEKLKKNKVSKPIAGQFAKANLDPHRYLREFRLPNGTYNVGDEISVSDFEAGERVNVTGRAKGRGFQGVVKRHNFRGVGMATHGQHNRQRHPGSIGMSSDPSRVFKGMRMGGRMGGNTVKVRNLEVIKVIPESNLILVKGSIPGAPNSIVEIVRK